ncbi:MAG: alkaline phosphatase, partial [Clostridium sp.]
MNKRIKAIIAATLAMTAIISIFGFNVDKTVKAGEVKRSKNVIMLIADGMSTEGVTLSRYVKGSSLSMDEISSGSVMTSWLDGPITDSAPGGTAYSAGVKTSNKFIATAPDKTPLATMVEGSESIGKATGIVSTSEITHATPADFTAHINDRSKYNSILRQQINGEMEVVIGGGFNMPSKYKEVSDFNKYYSDRINEIEKEGFKFVKNKEAMKNFKGDKLWGSFASADLKYDYDRQADKDEEQPSLAQMTSKAIEVLNKDEDGFFLMVEGS